MTDTNAATASPAKPSRPLIDITPKALAEAKKLLVKHQKEDHGFRVAIGLQLDVFGFLAEELPHVLSGAAKKLARRPGGANRGFALDLRNFRQSTRSGG